MGSPLGPVLAKTFVGNFEFKIPCDARPKMHCRYVDDIFSRCQSQAEINAFYEGLNNVHPALIHAALWKVK